MDLANQVASIISLSALVLLLFGKIRDTAFLLHKALHLYLVELGVITTTLPGLLFLYMFLADCSRDYRTLHHMGMPFAKLIHVRSLTVREIILHVTGSSVGVTFLITVQLMASHLFLAFRRGRKEKLTIVSIIVVVPMYALASYTVLKVCLTDSKVPPILLTKMDFAKEFSEAVAMVPFLDLMHNYANDYIHKSLVPEPIQTRKIQHYFPITCFQPHTVPLDSRNLKFLKDWTLQFSIVRIIFLYPMLALQYYDLYPSWASAIFNIIFFLSGSLAVYSLVVYYRALEKELTPYRIFAKFLCIKGVVFVSFWQGVLLWFLSSVGIIGPHNHFFDAEAENIQEVYGNILLCLEMLVFSIMQCYAYPPQP